MRDALPCLLACACGGGAQYAGGPTPGRPALMPVVLVEHRFVVETRTRRGDPLHLYTDSGGGLFVFDSVLKRLGLPRASTVKLDLDPAKRIPLPPDGMPVLAEAEAPDFGYDGMLGQAWFANGVWTFDYPDGRLYLRAPGDLPPHDKAHEIPVGFAKSHETSFPRVQITVDGQVIDVLLDTGAMVTLTDGALAALGGGARVRATSFMDQTIFDGWHARHPDWRELPDADSAARGEPMIEVPEVTIAKQTVGPVWFTRRPDKNFREWMSQWMDRTVDGAFGGSGLRYFRVTVDYVNAVAVFEQAR